MTEEGRKQILQDYINSGRNIQQIAQGLPEADNGNAVIAAIGKGLDLLSSLTGGILPSHGENGGLLGNLPVLLGADDINYRVIQITTGDSAYMQANPDLFVPIEESRYFQSASAENRQALQGRGLYVSIDPVTIDEANATYQNFVNGMLNSEGDAIKNGIDQTGATTVTISYNPTHGFFGDLLESGVDKFTPIHTGIAQQTGDFIYDVTHARGQDGSNFAAHSQGNLLIQSGIEDRLDDGGGFDVPEYFLDVGAMSQEEKDESGIPSFASFGSPVNTEDMKETIVQGANFIYSGAYTHENDFVGETLGGNRGQNEQMDLPGRVQGLVNIPTLFAEDSPHSTYLCGEHQNARCGDKP